MKIFFEKKRFFAQKNFFF